MSHEHGSSDELPDGGQEALAALRNIWSATDQTSARIDESCGNTDVCKSMDGVGFHGLAGEDADSGGTGVGNSIRAAWRTQLEREGKLATGTGSVRDLILGADSKKQ